MQKKVFFYAERKIKSVNLLQKQGGKTKHHPPTTTKTNI